MSRSFRKKPFQSVCGGGASAKRDKVQAHRGARRAQDRELRRAVATENFDVVLPSLRECPWNNVYSWGRDGNQRWCGLTTKDYADYVAANTNPESWVFGDANYTCWPPVWYVLILRK